MWNRARNKDLVDNTCVHTQTQKHIHNYCTGM